jgi:lipopolysaccharide transport system permease protein
VVVHITLVEAVTLAMIFPVFLTVVWLVFGAVPVTAVYLPLLLVFQQALAFCIGLIAAILTVFLRDVKEVVSIIVFLWFWLTPIVYLIDDVPWIMRVYQPYNPAYWFVEAYHNIMVYQTPPDFAGLGVKLAGVALLTALFLRLLRKWERDIRDFI